MSLKQKHNVISTNEELIKKLNRYLNQFIDGVKNYEIEEIDNLEFIADQLEFGMYNYMLQFDVSRLDECFSILISMSDNGRYILEEIHNEQIEMKKLKIHEK
jgi:hypothetical protein